MVADPSSFRRKSLHRTPQNRLFAMKELLEALSEAMITEGTSLGKGTDGKGFAMLNTHDAAAAAMLKGFGRALANTATKLQPSKPKK